MNYKELYLIYWNEFLTLERFAESFGFSYHKAKVIRNFGRVLLQDNFGHN